MTKSDLTKALAKELNLSSRKSEDIVNTVFNMMSKALAGGGRIEIRGFGAFSVRQYGGYTGLNPKTGEKIAVKGKRLPFFRAGKEFKEGVDGKPAKKG